MDVHEDKVSGILAARKEPDRPPEGELGTQVDGRRQGSIRRDVAGDGEKAWAGGRVPELLPRERILGPGERTERQAGEDARRGQPGQHAHGGGPGLSQPGGGAAAPDQGGGDEDGRQRRGVVRANGVLRFEGGQEVRGQRREADGQVVVIHNGVPLQRFYPGSGGAAVRRELGLSPEEVAVGMVGNFVPWKNHELFLRSAALLGPGLAHVRFFVVGGEVFPENLGREATLRFRAGDACALATALRRLIEDAGLRRAMGEAARARMEAGFSIERQVREIQAVYHALLRTP